ncbi:MAG TPA: FUSC family protein [Bryobacteraceae bacterium]|nr:FUSC family protein [Bryobacteraceae bacterium]
MTSPSANEPRPGAWAALWQTVIRFQGDKLAPGIALRTALGVTLPLVAGVVTGAVSTGLLISTGALDASFSDSNDPYVQRGRRMITASLFVALAVFAGAISGGNHPLAVAVSSGWAFAAGMMVALGTTHADVGVISLVTLVVFAAQPMAPETAAYSGLLALGGGLLQTLYSVALWPIRPYEPERRALADLFLELSRAATDPTSTPQAPPATDQSNYAQISLGSVGRSHSIEGERYLALLKQAERMRLTLVTLARVRRRLRRDSPDRPENAAFDACFRLSSSMLAAIGQSLLDKGRAAPATGSLQELEKLAEQLRNTNAETLSAFTTAMLLEARFQIDALAGQLRSAFDLAGRATPAGRTGFEHREARQPWYLRLRGSMATLRANLSLDSTACRHAIRLAACVAIGDSLVRGLGWHRSYWVPMTIAIVLKPDFSATFSRGVLRLAGTFTGLVAATALFHFIPYSVPMRVALIGVMAFVLRCFGPANYGIFVTAITALVVLLFALSGVAPGEVMAARGMNTAMGGLIALAAYWIWPTWERTQVPEAMAQMLETFRSYFRAVRNGYVQPESSFAEELDRTRVAARLARSNLEASADRASAEPGIAAQGVSYLDSMLASSHRLAYAMMALEAGLSSSRSVPAREAFDTFANDVDLTLYYLAAALRGSPLRRGDLPDLREDHHRLIRSGNSSSERYALVNVETDRLTNSLNTLSEEVLAWISHHKPAQR